MRKGHDLPRFRTASFEIKGAGILQRSLQRRQWIDRRNQLDALDEEERLCRLIPELQISEVGMRVVTLAEPISTQGVHGQTLPAAQDQLASRLESNQAAKVLLLLREEEAGERDQRI